MTAHPSGRTWPCQPEELRSLFLFKELTPDQLTRLCREGRVECVPAGPVYREGDPATTFYVLVEGTVVLSRRVATQDVEVNRSSVPGVYAGAFHAYLGDQVPQVYNNSMRVTEPSRFFTLPAESFARVVHEWFPMAVHLLEGLLFGTRTTQEAVGQRERLLALGALAAGLTHELGNPAGAAVRATAALRELLAAAPAGGPNCGPSGGRDRDDAVARLRDEAVARARAGSASAAPSALAAADAEDAIADRLDELGVSDAWELAPVLVQAGLDEGWLDRIAEACPHETDLARAVREVSRAVETALLLDEIADATRRVLDLVDASRQYTQLDRAPYQLTDVHELLDSTLQMLSPRLGARIDVVRDYDRALPRILAHPGELNQVWTNLVDNAAWAMRHANTGTSTDHGTGTLTVRTARDGDRLLVEFRDTGPGIPPEIRDRLFDPFFTTKPVGEGTGLGLDISWRIVVDHHGGDLRVDSVPGDTRFQVRLPLGPADPDVPSSHQQPSPEEKPA
ncbi:ATP-binding protein [Streptacidiphilus fuscans]|uniref:histidine kinase n=1 Tax=Streptacidiphilus fuscans TaxID=2789292 RepID=A0A931AWE0_9ACTN|nr:ATP-binding protein [Streptacidiphilus fuscans]MBF9066715.1 histidine kinase [Streptacidiphilus fuscans]